MLKEQGKISDLALGMLDYLKRTGKYILENATKPLSPPYTYGRNYHYLELSFSLFNKDTPVTLFQRFHEPHHVLVKVYSEHGHFKDTRIEMVSPLTSSYIIFNIYGEVISSTHFRLSDKELEKNLSNLQYLLYKPLSNVQKDIKSYLSPSSVRFILESDADANI